MFGLYRRMAYQWQVLCVYVVAVFMTIIDGTMVNVALPAIASDFGTVAERAELVAIAYLLAVASVIPATGWLGDRFGTRKVMLVSLVLFVVASIMCAVSTSLNQLVATRILQGVGGGMLAPTGAAVVFRAFPMSQRATAAATVLSVAVTGPAIGPVLGGFLVDFVSWHWIFGINLPIGLLALWMSWVSLHEERSDNAGPLDIAGLVLSSISISSLLYALTRGARDGWGSATVITLAVVGAAAGIALVIVERRVERPMLTLGLFHTPLFRTINLSSSTLYMGFFGFIFVLPLYLQNLRGLSALQAGVTAAPQAVGILLVSLTISKWAYRTIGPRRLLVVGGLVGSGITSSFALLGTDTSPYLIAAMSFARGVVMGLVFIAIQTAVYAQTTLADTGRATSLFNTQRQFSFATGVAIGAAVLSAGGAANLDSTALERLPAYRWAFLAVGLVMIPGALWGAAVRNQDVAETRGIRETPQPGRAHDM